MSYEERLKRRYQKNKNAGRVPKEEVKKKDEHQGKEGGVREGPVRSGNIQQRK